MRRAFPDHQGLGPLLGGAQVSIAHGYGGPYIRGPYCHEPARLEVLLQVMQGLGRPGTTHSSWWNSLSSPSFTRALVPDHQGPSANTRRCCQTGSQGRLPRVIIPAPHAEADHSQNAAS